MVELEETLNDERQRSQRPQIMLDRKLTRANLNEPNEYGLFVINYGRPAFNVSFSSVVEGPNAMTFAALSLLEPETPNKISYTISNNDGVMLHLETKEAVEHILRESGCSTHIYPLTVRFNDYYNRQYFAEFNLIFDLFTESITPVFHNSGVSE